MLGHHSTPNGRAAPTTWECTHGNYLFTFHLAGRAVACNVYLGPDDGDPPLLAITSTETAEALARHFRLRRGRDLLVSADGPVADPGAVGKMHESAWRALPEWRR